MNACMLDVIGVTSSCVRCVDSCVARWSVRSASALESYVVWIRSARLRRRWRPSLQSRMKSRTRTRSALACS